MWRWTAIIAAFFAYLPARFFLVGVVTGTSATDIFIVEVVPFIAALIVVAIILFAIH